jgi:hypothetical protein
VCVCGVRMSWGGGRVDLVRTEGEVGGMRFRAGANVRTYFFFENCLDAMRMGVR